MSSLTLPPRFSEIFFPTADSLQAKFYTFIVCSWLYRAAEFLLTVWCPLLTYGKHMKHHVPDLVKLSFVIFDIRTLWCSELSVSVLGWHMMLHSCTYMATVGVRGLQWNFTPHCSFISAAGCNFEFLHFIVRRARIRMNSSTKITDSLTESSLLTDTEQLYNIT